jgi:hypothetical protein
MSKRAAPGELRAKGLSGAAGSWVQKNPTDWQRRGDLAVCQPRSELCARLTKEFAGDRSRRKDGLTSPRFAACSMSASESPEPLEGD